MGLMIYVIFETFLKIVPTISLVILGIVFLVSAILSWEKFP